MQDPIADSARAILDGHIVLSRKLAEEGIYPAIDVNQSLSRCMPSIANKNHQMLSLEFRQLNGLYSQVRDLISVGAYKNGFDTKLDRAVENHPNMIEYITQPISEKTDFSESVIQLEKTLRNH